MIRRIYILTAAFAIAGFIAFWTRHGFKTALAFLLGSAVSCGNLYLFDHLATVISPNQGARKPWATRAFISRYLLMFAGGYVIVKGLGVSPLAVLLGLLASTAAVVSSIVVDLLESLFTKSSTP